MRVEDVRRVLAEHGQDHVLQFYDTLSQEEKRSLMADLGKVDWGDLEQVRGSQIAQDCLRRDPALSLGSLSPFSPIEAVSSLSPEVLNAYKDSGLRLINDGKVAALIFAGGQGTRLGFPHPKGLFDLDMPSHKSIFEYQVERIRKVQLEASRRFNSHLPKTLVLVMTNEESHEEVKKFFVENGYFGLETDDVVFFPQGMLPAVTPEGKAILKSKSSLSLSPNGNGGVYSALVRNGLIHLLGERGVQYVHVFGIDNVLNKACDPLFFGYMHEKHLDLGIKVVAKASPKESVGLIVLEDGTVTIAEYSKVPPDVAQRVNAQGTLEFNHGNICNQVFSFSFLQKVCSDYYPQFSSRYNTANKTIEGVDEAGVKRQQQCVKFELFYFEAFRFAEAVGVLEVDRASEFAPVKNAEGVDSPASARKMMSDLHKSWLEKYLAKVESGSDSRVEVSGLVSYEGENLGEFGGMRFSTPVYIFYSSGTRA